MAKENKLSQSLPLKPLLTNTIKELSPTTLDLTTTTITMAADSTVAGFQGHRGLEEEEGLGELAGSTVAVVDLMAEAMAVLTVAVVDFLVEVLMEVVAFLVEEVILVGDEGEVKKVEAEDRDKDSSP